jgi:hypothetical protein
MTAEYDPHTERPIQTFQIPYQIQDLGVATENVVTKFTENWGADYTCLYRVSGERALKSCDVLTDANHGFVPSAKDSSPRPAGLNNNDSTPNQDAKAHHRIVILFSESF